MEDLKDLAVEVIQFARSHRKELKPAEQWLNSIDDDMVEAWVLALQGNRDWRRILFLEWMFTDEKLYENELEISGFNAREWCENERQQLAAHGARMRTHGSWRTERHPVYYIVRDALEEGRQAVQKAAKPKHPISLRVAVENYDVSRVTLIRMIEEGKLKSYRPENATGNARHIIDAAELAAQRTLRGRSK